MADIPDYARKPLQSFLDYQQECSKLLDCSMRGMSLLQGTPDTEATFVQKECMNGFPLLHAHNLVGCWGRFEAAMEDLNRRLVRRIEVKGWGTRWQDDQIVQLSDRQFLDALGRKSEGASVADDFDYWIYVVERWEDGTLHVLPIRNPAHRAAKFEFRGGTWRALAEQDAQPED